MIQLLRNEGNLESSLQGKINPKKRKINVEACEDDYAICVHCKGFFKRLSLSRHMKKCFAIKKDENNQQRPLSQSLVYAACHKKYGEILNILAVKEKIFSKMLPDAIASAAMNDILIIYWGEDLLKKNKNKRSIYHLSNKLRECGKFLLAIQNLGS